MSFRQKLLLLFAATVLLCVAVMSASVYSTIRRSFEQADQVRAQAVAAQFQSEFQRRGSEVARKVESVAASEAVQRIALDMNRGATDAGEYVGDAHTLAGQQQLDFLELVDSRGVILSSAQWQGRIVSETRRIAEWRNPRPVCRAGCPRRRTTFIRDRRRTPGPGFSFDARHPRRNAGIALSKPCRRMESEDAA